MSRSPVLPTDDRLAAWGAPAGFRARLEPLLPATPEEAPGAWMRIVDELLEPAQEFALHEAVFAACYAGWDEAARGPAPAWVPSDDERRRTNLATLGQGLDMAAVHRFTVDQAGRFWTDMLEELGIVVDTPPASAVETAVPAHEARWFPGMRLNIVESCLSGRDLSALALVAHAEDGSVTRWTLGELRQRVVAVADLLRTLGVQPGDAVAIDMPMTPWSVPIYLGIVAVGAAVVSIADSFAPDQIRTRLEIGGARLIFTQDVIRRGGRRLPLYDRVVAADA
ncbi:MAG: AMP-dependent synthetase, partial [Deltaproteobacteria bacterium]